MIPILIDGAKRGSEGIVIGKLTDAVNCEVTRMLDGEFELVLDYPVFSDYFKDISLGRFIKARPDFSTYLQLFEIYEISEPLNGYVTVYAHHAAFGARKTIVSPFSAQNRFESFSKIEENAINNEKGYKIYNSLSGEIPNVSIKTEKPMSMMRILREKILPNFGGEIAYNDFDIFVVNRVGEDKGASIRYGQNLVNYVKNKDSSEKYDGIYPYYYAETSKDEETGEITYDYLELPEKVLLANNLYNERIASVDLTKEFDEIPTESELRIAAQKYMSDHGMTNMSEESLEIDVAVLSQTEEYKNTFVEDKIDVGDTVTVVLPRENASRKMRCVKVVFDVLTEQYKTITLGRIKEDIIDKMVVKGDGVGLLENNTGYQTTSSIDKAVASSTAGLTSKVTANSAAIESLAQTTSAQGQSIATIQQETNANEAKISLVVGSTQETGNYIKTASIVAGINNSASIVKINADKIDLTGSVIVKSGDNVSELTNDAGYKDEAGIVSIINGTVTADYIQAKGVTAEKVSCITPDGYGDNRKYLIQDGYGKLYQKISDHQYVAIVSAPYFSSDVNRYGFGDTLHFICGFQSATAMPKLAAVGFTNYNSPSILMAETNAQLVGSWSQPSAMSTQSDRKMKHDIALLDEKYGMMFDKINAVSYKYNDGTSGRTHTGFIADDVEQAILEVGLTTQDFAGFVKTKKYDIEKETEVDMKCLRYEEFIAVLWQQVKDLKKRVEELEKKGNV